MLARELERSAAEFTVKSYGQIQETTPLLETWWELFYGWCMPTDKQFIEDCKKHNVESYGGERGIKTNPLKTTRLNAYILSYLEHENFTKSCAAFAEEAHLSFKDELFSKFWIPLEGLQYHAKASNSDEPSTSTLQVALPLEDLSFKKMTLYEDTTFRIATCHFSADGKLLAFGGTDRMVSVWDMDSSKMLLTTPDQPNAITEVRFHPNSTSFAFSCLADNLIRLWDVKHTTGPSYIFHGHTSPVMSLDFCPSKPQILCSSDNQGEVCFWNVISGDLLSKLKEGEDIVSKAVRFVTKEMLAAALGSRLMMVWILDEEECKKPKVYQYLEGHIGAIKSICWDGARHLASVSEDSARVWSMTNGRWTAHYSLDSGGHKFGACEFHPSHPNLLLIGSPQYIHVWDFTHGDKTRMFLACTGSISALTASHKTGLIACSSRDSRVNLWKLVAIQRSS